MSQPMSDAEVVRAMEALSIQIERYAHLLVHKGCNLQPGQELVLQAPVERADFARRVVAQAYQAGAGHVTVIWADDEITRLTYENVELSYFEHTPAWKKAQLNDLAEQGAAFLFLEGSDPSALKGIDPAKPAAAARSRNEECRSFRDGMDFGRNVWCIAGVPVSAWATQVYPALSPKEAVYRLWLAILATARSDGEDPEADWDAHDATFAKNLRLLNKHHFDRLHYRSKNGTDLTIGLNPDGLWAGGAGVTQSGIKYFPNIPTEEVFTSPDRTRADGIVYSALPLVHAGQVVSDFWLKFEGGRVVDYDAAQGKSVLKQVIETDDNSCRLGECALISKNTPIRQTGILFYDTLYDENASCHLALGMGFPECVEGGFDMSSEQLVEHGVNQSHTHVDFMIGSDDIDIWGITREGEKIQLFADGQWVWEQE